MAFTYLALNLLFIGVVVLIFAKSFRRPNTTWWMTLALLLSLTLIFDNLAIWAGMFSYTPERILGLRIGLAPVEDFFYALFAVLIIPTLWHYFSFLESSKKKRENHDADA